MAWEVLGEEEREDGYHVRLSYQPTRGFRGAPGVGEFAISRTGSGLSRRAASEPAKQGGLLGCSLVATGGLLLAAGGFAGIMGALRLVSEP